MYGTCSWKIFSWTKFFKSHKFFIWIGICNALPWSKLFTVASQNFGKKLLFFRLEEISETWNRELVAIEENKMINSSYFIKLLLNNSNQQMIFSQRSWFFSDEMLWRWKLPGNCEYIVDELFRITNWRFLIPLDPACATRFANLCNAITCQPIELQNCSNPLRIQQVFYLRSKNIFFVLDCGFLKWGHDVVMFLCFRSCLPGSGTSTNLAFFWLNVFWKLLQNPLLSTLDWLASVSVTQSMAQKPSLWQNQNRFTLGIICPQGKFGPAINGQQIELESCPNPLKTRDVL